jgi:MFS family permease
LTRTPRRGVDHHVDELQAVPVGHTLNEAMTSANRQLGVLCHPDFRLLWLAASASVIGDMLVRVAVALFVVDLTGSATDVGLVLAAYTLPLVGFLLLGGVIADRLPRHLVVVATDLVRFVLHALLAILIVTGEIRIWHLVVIGTIFGSAEAFFLPAISGLLPQTVPEEEIQEANAITRIVHNLAEFAGPALATLLVLGVGAAVAFAIDAATFLLSAALLVRVRPRERTPCAPCAIAAADVDAGLWTEIRQGFGEVRARWIWATLAAFCVAIFVTAAFGAGTIAGSFAALRWRPRYPMRLGIAFVLLWPGGVALYAAGVTLIVVVPTVTLSGTGIALFEVWWITALAERIPPDRLSRVTSYDWMVSLALVPVGYVLAGPLAERLGAANVMLGGAVLGFTALALGLLPRQTRELERIEPAGRQAMPSVAPVPVA